MNDLRRLVWRYKAGYYLREQLRDGFLEEARRLRARAREVCARLQTAAGTTAGEQEAREFEMAAIDAERGARSARFDEALRAAKECEVLLEKLEEIWLARAAISRADGQLFLLSQFLRTLSFPAIEDFHILVRRATQVFETGQYRTARYIAEEASLSLARLTVVGQEGERFSHGPLQRLEHQEGLAASLDCLGVAQHDSDRCHKTTEIIRTCMSARQFTLAEALLCDLEAATAGLDMFLSQKRLAERGGSSNATPEALKLLISPDSAGNVDWRRAAAVLVEESLEITSRRLAQRSLAAALGQ